MNDALVFADGFQRIFSHELKSFPIGCRNQKRLTVALKFLSLRCNISGISRLGMIVRISKGVFPSIFKVRYSCRPDI